MPPDCVACKNPIGSVEAYEAFVIKRTPPGGDPVRDPQSFAISSLGPFCKACWEDLMTEYQEEVPCWKGAKHKKETFVREMLSKMTPEERAEYERKKAEAMKALV